jgi:hypothetical protein
MPYRVDAPNDAPVPWRPTNVPGREGGAAGSAHSIVIGPAIEAGRTRVRIRDYTTASRCGSRLCGRGVPGGSGMSGNHKVKHDPVPS